MNAKPMGRQVQPEVIKRMVEDLQARNWYGKVTLTFEEGDVANIRSEESIAPSTLENRYPVRRTLVVKAHTEEKTPPAAPPEGEAEPATEGEKAAESPAAHDPALN